MEVLFIGDIVGNPGRRAVKKWLPDLIKAHNIDITVANAENVAGGLGATSLTIRELFDFGVNVVTLGNHVWRRKELVKELDSLETVVRPANFPGEPPGKGSLVFSLSHERKLGVINLLGRVFMEPLECPFSTAEREIERLTGKCDAILVDFHAEATSEKVALARFLDGRCAAVVGTHTHVQTADEQIFPLGTGYITDVGMTGPIDSVIGVTGDAVIARFRTGLPVEFKVADGRLGLHAVIISIDEKSGRTEQIQRIRLIEDGLES